MISKEHIRFLENSYKETCEDILIAFCNAYKMPYERDSWVGGDVGTIACVGDYFFDFHDVIKFCVFNSLDDWNELMEWYDYTLWANEYNQVIPNFESWHKGCPRIDKNAQEHLSELKKQFENAIKQYKENLSTTQENGK